MWKRTKRECEQRITYSAYSVLLYFVQYVMNGKIPNCMLLNVHLPFKSQNPTVMADIDIGIDK